MEVERHIDCTLEDLVLFIKAYPEMIKGALLSDAIVILSSLNVIAGELDA
jgi:NADH:ubiquinone oxidoreductase subunit D